MAPNYMGNSSSPTLGNKSGRQSLKKGPWTTCEDSLLVEYVKKHGEGNWNAVQRNSGLMRCGKSCRLRWANHLRPNLKKGAFSPDEERLIVELHAKFGNKWARMASQMPGRTDNEIKNYWNTRLKRRQRAGLPIYPQEMRQEQQQQQLLMMNNSSFSSLLPSSNPNPIPFGFFNQLPPNMNPQHNHLHAMSFSSPPFLNQGHIQYNINSHGFGINSSMGGLGLPSIQSAASSSDHFMMGTTTTSSDEEYEVNLGFSRSNKSTGLLEDLLGESSQAFGGVEIVPEDSSMGAPENVHEKTDFGFCHGTTAPSQNNYNGRVQKAPGDNINTVDDDLLNLLDNFPLAVPIPEWNEGNGYESSNLVNGTNMEMSGQPRDLQYNPVTTSSRVANQDWSFGSLLWNNMPTIS